jgi:hypothetical protein
LKLRPRIEAAANVGHIFYECAFMEEMAGTVNPSDFHSDIHRKTIFSSALAVDHSGRLV